MDYKTRKELDALSKELYGTTSKWRKMLAKGTKLLTFQGDGKQKKVQKFDIINHTYDTLKDHLLDIKVRREEAKKKWNEDKNNGTAPTAAGAADNQ